MGRVNEMQFKAKYPNAHLRETGRSIAHYKVVAVYAGDYLCAEGLTSERAYRDALQYEAAGMITPDPNEQRTA